MKTLYIVATPIGNLEDISRRALRVLGSVDLIAAEDTRTARILLDHYAINGRLLSYTDHNMAQRIPQILDRLAVEDVALVTDAGTPAISDPGVELAAAAREAGHSVVAVPGPSAVVAALSVAGLPTWSFVFLGFLPRTTAALKRLLATHERRSETLVAFESPQRLRATLAGIDAVLPARRLAVCRELTKLHEEVFLGTAAEALAHFDQPRGEIVLVIEGASGAAVPAPGKAEVVHADLQEMKRLGLTRVQATTLLGTRYGLSRRRLYDLWLASEKGPEPGAP